MNVIVVVNDSLRVDQLGCYQAISPNALGTRIETPNVDALAREAALFANAYAEGLPTMPTRTSWFTGRFTFPFRGGRGGSPRRWSPTSITCTSQASI
jgi:arylsulfatase A-like enzyme